MRWTKTKLVGLISNERAAKRDGRINERHAIILSPTDARASARIQEVLFTINVCWNGSNGDPVVRNTRHPYLILRVHPTRTTTNLLYASRWTGDMDDVSSYYRTGMTDVTPDLSGHIVGEGEL